MISLYEAEMRVTSPVQNPQNPLWIRPPDTNPNRRKPFKSSSPPHSSSLYPLAKALQDFLVPPCLASTPPERLPTQPADVDEILEFGQGTIMTEKEDQRVPEHVWTNTASICTPNVRCVLQTVWLLTYPS